MSTIQTWTELSITNEGVSATKYVEIGDGEPRVTDEAWFAWAELIGSQEGWSAFQDITIEEKRVTLTESEV